MIVFLSFIVILGLIMGSFANVCISRIPNDESVISPSSHCPKCNSPIKWTDNIPVISFFILKGKCRNCGEKISIQYPLIEIITAAAFLLVALHFGISKELPLYLFFVFILIIISAIDYFHMIIPDSLSLAILTAGVIGCFAGITSGINLKTRLINSILGVAFGGGMLFIIGYIGTKLLHKDALGGGDVKLLAAIGSIMGWTKIFPILFVASVIGTLVGITLIISKKIERTGYIPFGPFIALAAFINIFIPNAMGFTFLLHK